METNAEPRQFGRYELLERIGAGGMGEVYRARDNDLQRDVAIKVIAERLAADRDRVARFAQEARMASSLNHPNILTIHEIGQVDGRPFIVMELVEGQTVRQLIGSGQVSPRRALDIVAQVASGLAKAHCAGIVHRDVKPENIMVTSDGFAKILDFGVAKLRSVGAEDERQAAAAFNNNTTHVSCETVAGEVLGTASYMAPEQALGAEVDHRADQFALGAILYELATGRRAFRRESVVQTLSAVIEAEPEPIGLVNPSFPEGACAVARRCLAKDPQDRYAATLDLAHDLRALRDQLGEAWTPAPLQALSRATRLPARPASKAAIILAALVLVVLVPAVPSRVTGWIWPPSLPADVRLAVLLDDSRLTSPDRQELAPLLEYVTLRLADLHRFRASLSVVAVSELREAQVRSPGDARARTGATVSARLGVQRAGGDWLVSATLETTDPVRVVATDTRRFSAGALPDEGVVEMLARLLRIQLDDHERAAWVAATSGVVEARHLFARGVSQTPYQLAEPILQRYDQEQSLLQAISLFNRAIELAPGYADAHARLGEAYMLLYRLRLQGDYLELAARNAELARELDDTRPSVWITLGMIHAQKREFVEAEQAFRNAILRGPLSDVAYRELGRVHRAAKHPAQAEDSYRKAIDLNPNSWANYNAYGAFLVAHDRLDDAESAFRAAINRAPGNARVWTNLGALQFGRGRYADAERSLEKAVSLYEHGPSLSNLATLRYRVNRQYAEAARLFERAVAVAPRDYRIWRNLSSAYYCAPGDRERAAAPLETTAALLDEVLALEPGNAEAVSMLASVRAMQGQRDAAERLVARAAALQSPDPQIVPSFAAGVMELIGDRDAALRHVGDAFAAGAGASEFESDPCFTQLIADPRYRALAREAAQPGNTR
jgi:serine/threonine protein kinase/tetratricopeptide (TPR) repeat protein